MAPGTLRQAHDAVLAAALALPETCEESPWGERVVKVRRKVFLFSFSSDVTPRGSRVSREAPGEVAVVDLVLAALRG